MPDSTNGDMELLQKEENIQTLTAIFTPLIQAAVNDAMPPGLMELTNELRQARDDLAAARQEIEQVKASFIVAEDARKMGESITEVKTTTTAHEQEIAILKAANDTRFELVDKQITTMRRDIDQGVKSVVRSTRTMGRTVAKWLKETAKKEQDAAEREKKRQEEIDLKLQEIKEAREEDARRFDERLRSESMVVRDIDGRVKVSIDRQIADMTALKKDVAPVAFLFGTKLGWLFLGLLYTAGLIALAAIQQNPAILKAFIPAG